MNRFLKWVYLWPMIWLVWDCTIITQYKNGAEYQSWDEEILRIDLRWVWFWLFISLIVWRML